jgi:hypothetical protein
MHEQTVDAIRLQPSQRRVQAPRELVRREIPPPVRARAPTGELVRESSRGEDVARDGSVDRHRDAVLRVELELVPTAPHREADLDLVNSVAVRRGEIESADPRVERRYEHPLSLTGGRKVMKAGRAEDEPGLHGGEVY